MTKIIYDVEKSLKECPPNFYPPQVKFKKRIVVRRSLVDWDEGLQYRANVYETDNQAEIRGSYETFGFITTERPQCVTASTHSSFEYEGVCGFNRNAAQVTLGWETAIYDVLEFDSPIVKRAYGYQSNHIKAPRSANTDKDLLKGILKAVEERELDRTDDKAIKHFIEKIAEDKTREYRKLLFKKFRSNVSPHSTMRPLCSLKANELAEELKIPNHGLKNNFDQIGYVLKKFTPGNWWNGMEHLTKEGSQHKEVLVFGFVEDPAPNTLKAKRVSFKNNFNYVKAGVEKCLGFYDTSLNGNFPFRLVGFLPQDLTKTPERGGNIKESGIVDVDGKPVLKIY